MTLLERTAESVARSMDRRRFLRRSVGATFGLVAAWAVEGVGMPSALARDCRNKSSACSCAPIGVYCNTIETSWCSKGSCTGGCGPYPGIYEPTGCWCTRECCSRTDDKKGNCGYYKCCDCLCPGGVGCSCKHYVQTYPFESSGGSRGKKQ